MASLGCAGYAVDIGGQASVGDMGDPDNVVIAINTAIVLSAIQFNLSLVPSGGSYALEAVFLFRFADAGGPAMYVPFPDVDSATPSSLATVYVDALFTGRRVVSIELMETSNDEIGADATWLAGSTITLIGLPGLVMHGGWLF